MAFSGLAQHMLGRYVEAEALLREHLSRQPNNRPALVWLAATYARMGRLEEAQAAAAHILRLAPGYTIDGAARRFIVLKHSEHAERVFEALRSRRSTHPGHVGFDRRLHDAQSIEVEYRSHERLDGFPCGLSSNGLVAKMCAIRDTCVLVCERLVRRCVHEKAVAVFANFAIAQTLKRG